jgi:hypothetical protein
MNEQKKIIGGYWASEQLLENPNVYWDSDMVQTIISLISTAGFGDHDDLSVLLCDDRITYNRPSTHLKVRGEDVQTATLTPSNGEESEAPVYVVWRTTINNTKVELARIQTGPFDFHLQGHLLQKRSTHAVEVDIDTVRQSGATKTTRAAMSARFTGPFQRTKQEQTRRLQVACAPKKGIRHGH